MEIEGWGLSVRYKTSMAHALGCRQPEEEPRESQQPGHGPEQQPGQERRLQQLKREVGRGRKIKSSELELTARHPRDVRETGRFSSGQRETGPDDLIRQLEGLIYGRRLKELLVNMCIAWLSDT